MWLIERWDSVCVVSIIRTPQVRAVSLIDPSWSDVNGVVWSVVELNIGIVSACLPTLRPLFTCISQRHCQAVSKLKNSATSHESPNIRLRYFNKSSKEEGYGELGTPADLQELVRPNSSREYASDWEVQKASVRSESESKSGPNGTAKKPELGPHTIRVTTEFDVRNVVGNDATTS